MTTRHNPIAPADTTPPTAVWWLDDGDDNSAAGVTTTAAGESGRIRDGGSDKTATLGDRARDSANDRPGGGEGDSDSPNGDRTATAGDGVSPARTTAAIENLSRFLSRLSQRLVLTYTHAGDVILDLHGYTCLREAASHAGRTYLHLADRAAIADLDRRTTPTSLIVIRSPSELANTQLPSIHDLLLACRLMMTAQIATLVLIDTTQHGHQATQAHVDRLRAAATRAGLCPAGRIIAVSSHGGGDRFLFYANDPRPRGCRRPARACRRNRFVGHVGTQESVMSDRDSLRHHPRGEIDHRDRNPEPTTETATGNLSSMSAPSAGDRAATERQSRRQRFCRGGPTALPADRTAVTTPPTPTAIPTLLGQSSSSRRRRSSFSGRMRLISFSISRL